MKLHLQLLCWLGLSVATAASAHDTWLLARPDAAAGNLTFDLTSGMGFPTLESPIAPVRVDAAHVRIGGRILDLQPERSDHSLVLKLADVSPGAGVAWVSLKPKSLDLDLAKVDEYMDEIGATAAFRESVKNRGVKRWRERYAKHAKTFVMVGAPAAATWSESVGQVLEIVPDTNPATLRAGSAFAVRVLRNGKPFAGFVLGIVGEGNTSIAYASTDTQGGVSFTVPRAGKWLLRGTDLRPSKEPDLEWESDFATLTFEVRK